MGVGHGHSHGQVGVEPGAVGPSTQRIRRMVFALAILLGFLVLEVVVGLAIGSLALLADAGHMVTDVVGMSMGLAALLLARQGSTAAARTFGWHRAEVLTAMANAVLLLAVAAWVMYEAIGRIGDSPEIPGLPLMLTAAAGLAANLVVMLMLRGDSKDSLAVRGAYLEVLADAVGSVGVLIAGDLHDLHVWTLTTGMDVATVHLTTDVDTQAVLRAAKTVLDAHGLGHATVQVESSTDGAHCEENLTW